jgi:hypothetical protein
MPKWNYGYIMFERDHTQEALMLYRAISSGDTQHVRLTTDELYFEFRDSRDGYDAIVHWGKKGSVRLYKLRCPYLLLNPGTGYFIYS